MAARGRALAAGAANAANTAAWSASSAAPAAATCSPAWATGASVGRKQTLPAADSTSGFLSCRARALSAGPAGSTSGAPHPPPRRDDQGHRHPGTTATAAAQGLTAASTTARALRGFAARACDVGAAAAAPRCSLSDGTSSHNRVPAATRGAGVAAAGAWPLGAGVSRGLVQQATVMSEEETLPSLRGRDMNEFPPERVRNFSIIAHIDHGKSTLADRLMEATGAIAVGGAKQYLDKLQVERERGITVKAQTVSLVYRHNGEDYLLNLIDTPGHVDFSYEVSRSLAACQGAVLLVDAAQGVQAQTLANFYLAWEQDLTMVPVLNKIDMPSADPDKIAEEMEHVLGIDTRDCLRVSAKTGLNLETVLPAVVDRMPAPAGSSDQPLRALLFDAYHDAYRGVICMVAIKDGEMRKGQRITAAATGEDYEVLEVGVMAPELLPTGRLCTGQVGYVITGMKNTRAARVGDTWHAHKSPVPALPGFKPAQSMVFAGVYPLASSEFEHLAAAIEKLTLNDSSISVKRENSGALGAGFRCGFLGMLHLDVFQARLEQEHGASVIFSTPTVPYEVESCPGNGQAPVLHKLDNPSQFPQGVRVGRVREPVVRSTLVLPEQYVGDVIQLCQNSRGEMLEHSHMGGGRVMLRYKLPLSELAGNFYNKLKSSTSGYASFDYEEDGMEVADLVRLDVLVHGEVVDALARIVPRERALPVGRHLCKQMKEVLDRHQFDISVQAAAGGKVIARETVKAARKNVLAKCYGGDITRKKKLLKQQKEGKAKMKRLGSVDVPQSAFTKLMAV